MKCTQAARSAAVANASVKLKESVQTTLAKVEEEHANQLAAMQRELQGLHESTTQNGNTQKALENKIRDLEAQRELVASKHTAETDAVKETMLDAVKEALAHAQESHKKAMAEAEQEHRDELAAVRQACAEEQAALQKSIEDDQQVTSTKLAESFESEQAPMVKLEDLETVSNRADPGLSSEVKQLLTGPNEEQQSDSEVCAM